MAEWDYKLFWDESINQLRQELGEGEYTIWLSNLGYAGAGETEITVSTPSAFFQEKFKDKYQKRLEEKLHNLTGKSISLVLNVTDQKQGETSTITPEKPAQDKISKEKKPPEKAAVQAKAKHSQLREEFTFEKYRIGKNNEFAANAALAISENPGTAYNPFLIYGGVGMGKTHLMQAIGNHIHDCSDKKVIFTTAENFTNEFIDSLGVTGGANKMNVFKNKYRHIDVLLIDDIHFFQDKPGVQEELFYTFNALMDKKNQIVFTCDRPASELKKMHERLKNRFEQCLNVDLQPPLYENRCAILKDHIKYQGISVPDDVVDLIAKNISTNVRDLISALNKLSAFTKLMDEPITLNNAQKVLIDFFSMSKQSNMPIEQVQRVVADYYQLSHIDLKGKKRTQKITFPRHIAMYLADKMTGYSLTEIGESFGGRDHSTVINACKKIEQELLTNLGLQSDIQTIQRQIREQNTKS